MDSNRTIARAVPRGAITSGYSGTVKARENGGDHLPPEKWILKRGISEIISGYSIPAVLRFLPTIPGPGSESCRGGIAAGWLAPLVERGFLLPRWIEYSGPIQGLMEILRRPPRGLSVENIDWRMLLLTLDLANQRIVEDVGPRPSRSGSR